MHRPATCPRRLLRAVVFSFLALFLALNVVAALQVRAATQFISGAPTLEQQFAAPLPQVAWTLLTGVTIPRPDNRSSPADHNLPYEVRMIPLGADEYLEAWYVPQPGSRGVVVMFSGYAGVKEALLTPAAHFYQFGYSSLLVDVRGAGGSSGNDTTLGIREAEDVAAAFAYAEEQWNQPLLGYGVSMGSAALLRAVAHNELQPAALILEGPFDRLDTTLRHRFDAVGVPSFPAADLLLFWGSIELGANGWQHNPVEYATHVACPTLVLHGELDPWITSAETEAIMNAILGESYLLTVPGQGHAMPFVYGDPELWMSSVRQFLDEASGT